MANIDINKVLELRDEAICIKKEMAVFEDKLDGIAKSVKSMLAKGYWYTCDIDKNWNMPKKYSIKEISFSEKDIYITVKEVFKKKPWPSFTGEHLYTLDNFVELNIHKTQEAALDAFTHRICPKCGGFMGKTRRCWCDKCVEKRFKEKEKFEKTHRFYCEEKDSFYYIGYYDDYAEIYNLDKGYYGEHFKFQRLDTNEIIETDNLWSWGAFGKGNKNGYPEIKFLEGDE